MKKKVRFVFLLQRFSLVVQEREYIRVRGFHLVHGFSLKECDPLGQTGDVVLKILSNLFTMFYLFVCPCSNLFALRKWQVQKARHVGQISLTKINSSPRAEISKRLAELKICVHQDSRWLHEISWRYPKFGRDPQMSMIMFWSRSKNFLLVAFMLVSSLQKWHAHFG